MKQIYQPTCRQLKKSFFRISIAFLLICFLSHCVNATTYYVAISGNDNHTASEASNPSTPWRTLSKINAVSSILRPGDSILFRRGDRFYGTLRITRSGTNAKPIVYGAYGEGPKPVLAGNIPVNEWVPIGNGRYKANSQLLSEMINVVTINGLPQEMGRYPNSDQTEKGYLKHDEVTNAYIEDEQLAGGVNWKGAELVLRTNRWLLDRMKIIGHNGKRLYYQGPTTNVPKENFGYFIQNDIRTLDRFGEWAYDEDNKQLAVFFGNQNPADFVVRVSIAKVVVDLFDADYIVINDLSIDGANEDGLVIAASNHSSIKQCDITNSGVHGIIARNAYDLQILDCSIQNSNSIGIFLQFNTNHCLLRGNKIHNSGIWPGMARNGNNMHVGVRVNGNHNLVEYNTIDSTGYSALRFTGNHTTIRYNFIRYFGFVKDDAGGIYTGSAVHHTGVGRKIINNIIMDGIGAKEGTNTTRTVQVSGIYLDNNATGLELIGNTVVRCGKMGIYVHNAQNVKLYNNICFDNTSQIMLNHDDFAMRKVRNVDMRNNVFVAKQMDQMVGHFYSKTSDIGEFGVVDHNYYLRPLDEEKKFRVITGLYTPSQHIRFANLAQWKSMFGHDGNSKKSPKTFDATVNTDSLFHFVYNASVSEVEVAIPGIYMDARSKTYEGSIKLAPYTSAVLIKTGELPQETPSDLNVVITHPKPNAKYKAPTSVFISADAATSKGSIKKVEFYSGNELIDVELVAPYAFTWNNLKPGEYEITAKVYDDADHSVVSEVVTFTVTEENQAPETFIFTPFDNAEFTAPASVRIRASAEDQDGSIAKVEFYSGDSSFLDIEYDAPYGMRWRNLQAGTYKVFVKAYDNKGAVAFSEPVTFVVKPGNANNSITARTAFTDSLFMEEDQGLAAAGRQGADLGVAVYPNPAASHLFVSFSDARTGPAVITIRNAAGSVVRSVNANLEANGARVDVSGLLTGNYIITVSQGAYQVSRKFQKQ